MERTQPEVTRRRAIGGAVTGVIVASLLGAVVVAAQSPDPGPSAGGAPVARPAPSVGPWHPSRGGDWNDGRGSHGGPGMDPGMGRGQNGRPGMDQMPGRRWGSARGGYGRGFGRGDGPMVGGRQAGQVARRAITVTAITDPNISLATDDGWTRDIDTTGVVISRAGQAITLADVSPGDTVRVVETRNADGSFTVTGIEVQLALVQGTVASVDSASFTVTEADGTIVTVRVSDTTQWLSRRGSSASLASLTVGSRVVAAGVRAADGSIDATAVGVRGTLPTSPTSPSTSPSPAATEG
jgi:hypothetical protein